MRKFLKNVSYLMCANIISFLISALITFIVPKFLSVESYSYFQLYLFYLNYIGFCCIGWIDGIVLRYGGKYYNDLDKGVFGGQFRLYSLLEICIGISIIIGILIIQPNDQYAANVYIMLGIAIILAQVNAFFRYILQAVNDINKYALNIILEKIVYVIFVSAFLLLKQREFIYLIYADLFGKAIALLHMCITNREIIFAKAAKLSTVFSEAKINVSTGIKLLAANGSSLLIIGIVRYAIQLNWSVETFGRVSLSLSVSNMFMLFVQAIGVSLFPMLRRIKGDLLNKLYVVIRHTLMFPMLGLLIFYYPAYLILSYWLPDYAESLHYMALMFPICIFESKMQLLIEPYLKSLRREKDLLLKNLSAVGLSLLISVITIGIFNSLNLAVLSIVIVLAYRCVVTELVVERSINIKIRKDIVGELVLVFLFIIFNWSIGGVLGCVLYVLAYISYIILNRNTIKDTYNKVKAMIC